MIELTDKQAEQTGKLLADLFLLEHNSGLFKTAVGNLTEVELAKCVAGLLNDLSHDKHIVFSVQTGFVKFRDSLNRAGSMPVFTTVDDTIETTKTQLQIDDTWSIEIID